ncbi:hypothetical protein ElyMa_001837900 [Elysia marginata]|uniref:Uncharacterized protein n=1 Tax=Elysia marginata TaxID=1093978 RepID=A0AAV4EJH0_9GAST|nr:hypothetical protein ElyMa_001837900 [Elysia marginata]
MEAILLNIFRSILRIATLTCPCSYFSGGSDNPTDGHECPKLTDDEKVFIFFDDALGEMAIAQLEILTRELFQEYINKSDEERAEKVPLFDRWLEELREEITRNCEGCRNEEANQLGHECLMFPQTINVHTEDMVRRLNLQDPTEEEQVLNSMTTTKPALKDPLSSATKSLDNEISAVLEDEHSTDSEKLLQYHQLLHRYLTRHNQLTHRPLGKLELPDTETKENPSFNSSRMEQRIIESVPLTMKKKAKLLLDHLKDAENIGWNEQSELVVRGKTIQGSNLSDLVNDVLRQRKNSAAPQGWETFARALNEINTPRELVGHQARWDFMKRENKKRGNHGDEANTDQSFSRTQFEKIPVESSPLVSKRKRRQRKAPNWLTF